MEGREDGGQGGDTLSAGGGRGAALRLSQGRAFLSGPAEVRVKGQARPGDGSSSRAGLGATRGWERREERRGALAGRTRFAKFRAIYTRQFWGL